MYAQMINEAVVSYFGRITRAEATPEEIRIFPEMIRQFSVSAPTEAKGRDDIPSEGLLTARQVCELIGRGDVKQPSAYLIRQVKMGKFPPPWQWQKPYRWLRQDIDELMTNGGQNDAMGKKPIKSAFRVAGR